jgi:hypothetical protein
MHLECFITKCGWPLSINCVGTVRVQQLSFRLSFVILHTTPEVTRHFKQSRPTYLKRILHSVEDVKTTILLR